MAFSISALYDEGTGTAPLKWGENAVADGVFSADQGRVVIDDEVVQTIVSWTDSKIVFVPNPAGRTDGSYTVHIDNIPGVSSPIEYLHDFSRGTPITLGGFNGTPTDGVYTDPAHRASDATGADSAGVIQTVTSNVPVIVGGSLSGNIWSEAGGTQGLQLEEARTNEALHSADFTNAVWVKSGISVSGSQLTATGANGTITQTVTAASAQRTASFFISRVSGSGTIEISSGGGTWTPVTISGVGAYYRHTSTQTNPVIGIRMGISGDVIDVQIAQIEAGAFGSSGIVTAASPVTRAATTCSATFAQLGDPLPAGGFGNNYSFQVVATIPNVSVIDMPRFATFFSLANGAGDWVKVEKSSTVGGGTFIRVRDGYSGVNVAQSATDNGAGTLLDIRGSASASAYRLLVNGTWGSSAALADAPNALDTVELGAIDGNDYLPGIIHQFRLEPEALSDAEIEAWPVWTSKEVETISGDYGYTDYRPGATIDNKVVDASAAEWTVANTSVEEPSWPKDEGWCDGAVGSEPINKYPINLEFCENVTFTGGVVHSDVSMTAEWRVTYCNSAAFRAGDGTDNLTLRRLRVEGGWDGLRLNSSNWHIDQCYVSNIRDDCMENDTLTTGKVTNTLFEDVFVGPSFSPNGDPNLGQVLTCDGMLVGLQLYPYSTAGDGDPAFIIQTHGHGFKGETGYSFDSVILKNCVWIFRCAPFHSNNRWSQIINALDDAQSSNNTIIWATADTIPQEIVDTPINHASFTLDDYSGDPAAGEAAWDAIVAQWKINYDWEDATPPPSISPEAQAVLDRMTALTQAEIDAIIAFVDSQVTSGNWAKIDEFFCFALNASDYATGWKAVTGSPNAMSRGSNGMTPDNSGSYFDTTLIPESLTHFSTATGDAGIYVHSITYSGAANTQFFGCTHSVSGQPLRIRQRGNDSNDIEAHMNVGGNMLNARAQAGLSGHFGVQGRAGVLYTLFDGVQQAATRTISSAARPDISIFVASANVGGSPDGTTRTATYTSYYIGDNLDVANLISNMDTLHTALGVI